VVTSRVIDSNVLLPGTIFERRATPSDYGGAAEMILDRQFPAKGGEASDMSSTASRARRSLLLPRKQKSAAVLYRWCV
jgi:hypothetical protein